MVKDCKQQNSRIVGIVILLLGIFSLTVIDTLAQGTNVALRRPARQTSDPWGPNAAAGVAVDGNTNGQWTYDSTNSVTHTAADSPGPWWEVDLGQVYDISSIVLWNRTDCCRDRLDGFTIIVGETAIQPNDSRIFATDRIFGSSDSRSFTSTRNNRGRFVRIELSRPETLSLAEVQVFGTPLSSSGSSGGTTIGGTSSQDDQFWDTVKNSTNSADYEGYLAAFPNGNFAALARFKRDKFKNTGSGNQPPVPIDPADQRLWDRIKFSTDERDFQDYLRLFPRGQFARDAQAKIDQLRRVPATPVVDPADQRMWDRIKFSTDERDFDDYIRLFPRGQFVRDARSKLDQLRRIPSIDPADQRLWDRIKFSTDERDFQDYLRQFPSGQFARDAQSKIDQLRRTPTIDPADQRMWDRIKFSNDERDFQDYLRMFPRGQFARDAQTRIDQLRRTPANPVRPPSTSRNAQFLNDWASGTNTKLPLMIGDVQLLKAESHCLSGCNQIDNTESMVIRGKTPRLLKQNTSIGRLETALKPSLITEYCTSPGKANNVNLSVEIDDMTNQRIGNFFINPRDCSGGPSTPVNTNNPPSTMLPSGKTEAQLISSAQIGSIAELGRFRKFMVGVDDLTAKTNITDAVRKEVPQLQTAFSQSDAEFFMAVDYSDRTTGQTVAFDANNPNLRAEFIVFTVTQWVNNSPFNIRIHFRLVKDRNFGVFSATPEKDAAKEFGKQFTKIMR